MPSYPLNRSLRDAGNCRDLRERPDEQVPEPDQYVSAFIHESNVELPDARVIALMRVGKFRAGITSLTHGMEDIDLIQRKRQPGSGRLQVADQAGHCLQSAIH